MEIKEFFKLAMLLEEAGLEMDKTYYHLPYYTSISEFLSNHYAPSYTIDKGDYIHICADFKEDEETIQEILDRYIDKSNIKGEWIGDNANILSKNWFILIN